MESTAARGASSRWVTLRRACEILGVDESTLRRWADAGRLRVYRTPGGHRRFSLVNLEEMVAGEGKHRNADEVERLAVAKVRRQLQRAESIGFRYMTGPELEFFMLRRRSIDGVEQNGNGQPIVEPAAVLEQVTDADVRPRAPR